MSRQNQTSVGVQPNTPPEIDLDAMFRGSKVAALGILTAATGVLVERMISAKLAYVFYLGAGVLLDFRTNILRSEMRTKRVIAALKKRLV